MTKESTNWPQIPDHLYRILIIRGSAFGKKSLFNLVSQQPDTDNFFLYAKDPYKAKYKLLINKQESTG